MASKVKLSVALALITQLAVQPVFGCGDKLVDILRNAYPDAMFGTKVVGSASAAGDENGFDLPAGQPIHVRVPGGIACKVWPAEPGLTLVGVSLEHRSSSWEEQDADLEILVVDTTTSEVRYRLMEPGMMNSDAYRTSLGGFDTGRYVFSPSVLAFGVRTRSVAGGYAHGSDVEMLRLYAIAGNRLVRVLDELIIALQNEAGKEMSDGPHKNSCGDREEIKRTISMSPEAHGGFQDILVHEKKKASDCVVLPRDGQKWNTRELHRATYRLIYDGERYVMSAELHEGFAP